MRERITPLLVQPDPEDNLATIPQRNAEKDPRRVAFSVRRDGTWSDITAAQFNDEVRSVAKGLLAAGLEPGDRVGLMSRTRYEWVLLDFAIWTAGGVTVPIYESSSAEQMDWILRDSGTRAVIVETEVHTSKLSSIREGLPELQHSWQIDPDGIAELTALGRDIPDEELDRRRDLATRDSLATIIYTSGTTGRPKGCELTHSNFLGLCENAISMLPDVVEPADASILLFLPMAHVLARMIQVLAVIAPIRVGHAPDIKNLLDDLQSFRPSLLLVVPRVMEKVYNSAEQKAGGEGRGKIFEVAANTAMEYSRALDTGGPSLALRIKHKVFGLLVYGKLRDAMGGRIEYCVSGGAPLGERLGHFYRGIGIRVLEGYGLTETTAPTNVSLPQLIKVGTVGAPLPGVGIRIDKDGEVLATGVGVFRGYWNNEDATREAKVGDWFRTGDIGEMDDDGYLKITGRKKEIIITAGGKNVAPAPLEDEVRAHPLVSQCLVIGEQRPFISALITLDGEMMEAWGKAHGLPGLTLEQAYDNPVVLEHVQGAIDQANQHVSKAESIRAFRILRTDFTEDSGHMTPSLKLKRGLIVKDFSADIEAIYGG